MNYNNSKGQLTYQIEIDKQQKNGFPIPCDFKSTGKLGLIYPTQALPVHYGDTINDKTSAALQFNPLAVPIMANMFVKQEHYYTPYNCVWQNWDNFISGGEDLQFDTPPPAASMKRIWSAINNVINGFLTVKMQFARNIISPLYDISDAALVYKVSVGQEYLTQLETLITTLETIGDAYGIRDIVNVYFISKVKELQKFINDLTVVNNGIITTNIVLFNSGFVSPVGLDPTTYQNVLDLGFINATDSEVLGNEDWRFSYSQLERLYDNSLVPFPVHNLHITEHGVSFFRILYELVRPLVGVGSYLDCLNMNRVLPVDFYYLWLCSISSYMNILSSNTDSSVNYIREDASVSLDFASELTMHFLNLRVQYLIWYNNYRDQLLETKAMQPRKDDSLTDLEIFLLLLPRHRCWEKDSYTTALDNPATADAVIPAYNQRTHQQLTMQSFQVIGAGSQEIYRNDGTIREIKFANGDTFHIPTGFISGLSTAQNDSNTTNYYFSKHMLDAVTRAQKFLRKALFYGNRIQDFIYTNFSVKYLDARLRLPEILSTSSDMVSLSTLVNNTTVVTDQSSTFAGDRAGYANAYDKGNGFSRYCEEAGVIMSFLTVMPEPTYPYGSDRQYYKLDRYDHRIPDFATLGMDAVYDSEIVSCPNRVLIGTNLASTPLVFGYQGRYYDSKFRQSTEHGELLTTQDMYTFGRKWNMYEENGRPLLNYEFVHCFPVLDMFIMDDQTEDVFRFDVHHETTGELMLPYHSIYL